MREPQCAPSGGSEARLLSGFRSRQTSAHRRNQPTAWKRKARSSGSLANPVVIQEPAQARLKFNLFNLGGTVRIIKRNRDDVCDSLMGTSMIVKSLNRLEHMPKMGFTQKDQTVEGLADFANMPFGECVALRCHRRRSNHLDPVRSSDGIEGHEHGIAVVNEIAARQPRFAEKHGKIARLLSGPIAIAMRRATCDQDAPRAQVNEEQNVERDPTAQCPDLLGKEIGRPSDIKA